MQGFLRYEEMEGHLPINPEIPHINEGEISMAKVDILNWTDDDGNLAYISRIRETGIDRHTLSKESRRRMTSAVLDGEADEIDKEYDCD